MPASVPAERRLIKIVFQSHIFCALLVPLAKPEREGKKKKKMNRLTQAKNRDLIYNG